MIIEVATRIRNLIPQSVGINTVVRVIHYEILIGPLLVISRIERVESIDLRILGFGIGLTVLRIAYKSHNILGQIVSADNIAGCEDILKGDICSRHVLGFARRGKVQLLFQHSHTKACRRCFACDVKSKLPYGALKSVLHNHLIADHVVAIGKTDQLCHGVDAVAVLVQRTASDSRNCIVGPGIVVDGVFTEIAEAVAVGSQEALLAAPVYCGVPDVNRRDLAQRKALNGLLGRCRFHGKAKVQHAAHLVGVGVGADRLALSRHTDGHVFDVALGRLVANNEEGEIVDAKV